MNASKCFRVVLQVVALLAATYSSAWGATITIAPASPTVVNCFPFGGGGNNWTPYAGFIYKNIPAFSLQPGDKLAFDLGATNDTNIELQIEMAATTVNGGDIPVGGFTTIASNTQTPANPKGDTTIGNFELSFTSQASFSFPGGGLIIRFSNPSAAYLLDQTCSQVLVSADSSDSSGFFVKRYYRSSDGVSPYPSESTSSIGGFQIVTGTSGPVAPIPTLSEWGLIILSGLMALGTFVTIRRRQT